MAGKKLKDLVKGVWAVQAVPLHLINGEPPAPGQAPEEASSTIKVGVRVLLGTETAEALDKAQTYARDKGIAEWKPDHPICRLYEMACMLVYAVCDVDQETGKPIGTGRFPDAFFDSVDQMLASDRIGTDNIAYLYEEWVRWQDAKRGGQTKYTVDEMIGLILVDMEAKDSPTSPLLSLGHATLASMVRSLGSLLLISQSGSSPTSSPSDTSSTQISRDLVQAGAAETAEPSK